MTCLPGDVIGDYYRPLAIGDTLVFLDMTRDTTVIERAMWPHVAV